MKVHLKFFSLFLLLAGIVSPPSVFAEATITQGNIVMTRANKCGEGLDLGSSDSFGTTMITPCSIVFTDSRYGSGFEASLFKDRGRIWAENKHMIIFSSGNMFYTRSFKSDPVSVATGGGGFGTQSLPKAQFSLDQTGTMNTLSYQENNESESLDNFEVPTTKFLSGYYAIKDSSGLYWAAYLEYLTDDDNNLLMSWGPVDDLAHPWQSCSVNSTFSRSTGCADGGEREDPPNANSGKSLLDGAGSLISPTVDCYGCNKDIANMQPHQGSSSTVVFQWLYDENACPIVGIYANASVDVTIAAKGWSDTKTKEAFQVSLSTQQYFYLEGKQEWTTFSVTSNKPLTETVSIVANCIQATEDTGVVGQAISPSITKVDGNADWMGTGSLISQLNRDDFGVNKDIAIGSDINNAVTSFQWLASNACTSIRIGDAKGLDIPHDTTVSAKLWNATSFSDMCTSLPCDIRGGDENAYYVIKVKSSAGEFSGSKILSICQ